MEIEKIETNYKRNMFLHKTENILTKDYSIKVSSKVINVYPEIKYQSIIGFGGAFTEATGYALKLLSEEKQNEIINEYFSKEGLNYCFCRLPIGSSDFSKSSYSYSQKENLSDFNIDRDKQYIIPAIKKAQKVNNDIKFLSSPWSPPKFMKSNKMLILGGKLLEKYKNTWTEYLIKYINEYKKENIKIDYMTVQNEPNALQYWESCLYTPEEEADLAINYLYPKFKENNIETKILIWDHNKENLYTRGTQEITNNKALEAIAGFAYHWYVGDHFENIALLEKAFPGKLLIHTEGCTGYSKFNPNDEVKNAEIYGHDILGDLNAGTNGYIDWNMILNNKGGPNHKRNYCNSPIMINKDNNDYIKNLTFYYIGHFSKYIKPGARRIAFSRYTESIEVTAFKNTDESIAIVLLNRRNTNKEYNLCIGDKVIHDNLDSHAIVTYLIK